MSRGLPQIAGMPAKYRVEGYLSRGGHADVVEALNLERGSTPVALKLLRAEGSRAEVARMMFRREVEALKGLRHDAIVQIIDSFEVDGGLLGIELELVPGGRSLATLLEEVRIGREGRPTCEWRVRMAARLLDALLVAHKRNVIHRDIKPGNVLWNRDEGVLKLADFGIAAVLSLTAHDPGGLTLRSFFTRPFASPEQLLQRQPRFPSDVYGFALLTASLLAMRAPTEEFEPAELPHLLGPAVDELRSEGVRDDDLTLLRDTLAGALHDDPDARPSLTEIRDALDRIAAHLRPRPTASIVIRPTPSRKLADLGFVADGKILDDINADLRVHFDRNAQGERIKLFGRSLFIVLAVDPGDEGGARPLHAIDAGQNPGPTHESHRRKADPCEVQVRIGHGSSAHLLAFAREADREATRRATHEIVERARLIIDIERERLPVFAVEAVVEGRRVQGSREDAIGRASGFEGSQVERVEVNGGFLLKVKSVQTVPSAELKNVVRTRLRASGVEVESPSEGDAPSEDWYELLDEPQDVDVLDEHLHMVGKITGYDRGADVDTLHVQTDKMRRLPRAGRFFVKNHQKERLLRQQEIALDLLARGETVRPDMPHLLAEAAVHRMGERPWIELLQRGLIPEARVRDLVDRILASRSVFCLQGPPGTGKTTIIAEVVAQLLEHEPRSRILVCSQANDAVANAIERILDVRGELGRAWVVVRDVRLERAREEGPWAGYEAAYREFVERVKAGSGAAVGDGAADGLVRTAVGEWLQSVEYRTRRVERDHRGLVQVWGTTTARATRPLDAVDPPHYDLVIIDEAAKATVGEVLVPIVRAQRLLLVGDQKQLPPFLEDTTQQALQELGITEDEAKYSLFEHLYQLVPSDHRDMLNVQFRMHPTIGNVVSNLFYDGKVTNGPGTGDRPLPPGDFARDHRVMWVDVVGRDQKAGKTSRANDQEIDVVARLLEKLDADAHAAGMPLRVAVIAAYRGQSDKLQPKIRELRKTLKALDVSAATVDAFQGREADVVLYSLVRTGEAERRFLADGRRFNVALSRAKRLLILVGDRSGARGTPRLQQLLEMIPAQNQVSASSFVPVPRLSGQLAALLNRKPPEGDEW